MKSWVVLYLAIGLAACSSTGNKQQGITSEPSGQQDVLAAQLAESAFQESSGTLKLVFDAKGNWVKIISKGTADLADDSPRARETALMIAGMRAKRTVAEFLNNDVKSTKTLTRIARSYARNFQSSESRSADDADTDDSEAMSRPSDDQTSRSEKTRQAHRFASNLAERIHDNSSAIIKGAFVSYRSFEDGRVIVEITASRESIGAARQLSRLMSGVMP